MSLKKNIVANYLGQGWSALMGIVFVPLYIKYMGMEAYGLIGIFTLLLAWLTLLDMGMTPTLTREMARYKAGSHTAASIRDLLRSLEIIYILIAALISAGVWMASSWLGGHWLRAEKLSVAEVGQAISVMGFVIALRFVEALYRGAIQGLQKQVWLNTASALLATLRGLGAVGVLMWVSPSIEAFFLWQGVVSAIAVCVFAISVHNTLPSLQVSPKFSRAILMEIRHFAGGMMATTLLVLLLTQVDKILLSRLLTLEIFGYYVLAGTVASLLFQIIGPITQAFYPRFVELIAHDDKQGLVIAYHRSAQLVTVLVVPAALVLIFFGESLLRLWTGNEMLAHNVAPLLQLLTIGSMLNGVLHIPYMLQLSYGWTGFAVRVNIVAVTLLVPAILWVTPRYGAIGAASVWVALNAGYVLIGTYFMHKRILPQEKWRWYKRDLLLPGVTAALIGALITLMHPTSLSKLAELGWLLTGGILMVAGAWLTASDLPHWQKLLINYPAKGRKEK